MNEQTPPGVGPRPIRLQIGDQEIAACESAGSGRPIVLIHGNSSSSRIWRKQMEGPLGGKYRLVAIDLPGHGESGRAPDPERDYSAPGYSACVAGIAKQLELEEAVFVGWSKQVQVIAGAGHSTQWEQPQAFDEVFDAFASSV